MEAPDSRKQPDPDQPVGEEVKTEPQTPVVTAVTAKSRKSVKSLKKLIHKLRLNPWVLLVIVVVILFMASSVGAYYYHQANTKKPVSQTSTTTTTSPNTVPNSSSKILKAGTPNTGSNSTSPAANALVPSVYLSNETYFTSPVLLPNNLNFWADTADEFGNNCTGPTGTNGATTCSPAVMSSDISYYQIGTTAAGQPIIVACDNNLGEGDFAYVAIETSDNNYSILANLDDNLSGRYGDTKNTDTTFSKYLSSNVTLDMVTTLSGLLFPKSATVQGLPITESMPGYNGYFIPSLADIRGSYFTQIATAAPVMSAIDQQGNKTFYDVTAEDSTNYQVKEIYATVNQDFANNYAPVDPLSSSTSAPKIVWKDGTVNKIIYTFSPPGCGSNYGYVVAKNISPADLTVIGSGPQNQVIYSLASSSALFNKIYATDYAGGAYLNAKELENLTAVQFQNDHAFFLVQNSLGEYVIYERTDLFSYGGCAKPVIYLYPTQTTAVDVTVGANISKSDPFYPSSGWRNVIAQPDGQLTYGGKTYNSLYWEGSGLGVYPAITSGTVVKSNLALSTIKTQLAQQGLEPNEIADFLAFWAPKLPSTPFVRLTWFDTYQMNNLAPLIIVPQPTTLIRTFLDFQGLNHYMSLPSQSFQVPARQGFTVVEWGGLLRNSR